MTVEVRVGEWQELRPDATPLKGLCLADRASRELAEQLTRSKVLEIEELRQGVRVRARAHVGRIHVAPLTITIEPKITSADLLELLRFAYRLPPVRRAASVDVSGTGTLLQDLLCLQLLGEARRLMRGGLAKTYEVREENLESPRGKVDLVAIARGANAGTARLPCRHHLRLVDNELNQVLYSGVRLAITFASDRDLRGALRRVATELGADIGEVALTRLRIGRAEQRLTRLTESYGPAVKLIDLLYESSGIALDDEPSVVVPGFLFDMNRFFQALLSRLLADGLPDCQVEEESALTGMMRYVPTKNPRHRRAPRPRPDFLVRSSLFGATLLDAKYRDLWERELPREMLYQLAVYALSQPTPAQATIVYPATNVGATEAAIAIGDPVNSGVRAHVLLRPLHLSALVSAVRAPASDALQKIANCIAFGAEPTR